MPIRDHDKNHLPFMTKILEEAKNRKRPPVVFYDGLICAITENKSVKGEYIFSFFNNEERDIKNIAIDPYKVYNILGPNYFGLDDTHMPGSLTHEEPITIACLPAKESVSITRKRWGNLLQYNGPLELHINVKLESSCAPPSNNGYQIKAKIIA